ncbi:MAG: histidine kinase [Bacteroidales bacterium]|nr:histidine kinase [Bacteroidales bacterium]
MNSIKLFATIVLLQFFLPFSTAKTIEPDIKLKLERGDQLVYEILTENPRNSQSSNLISEQKIRFSLTVLDIPETGIYLISYKKLFTRNSKRKNSLDREIISSSDSRFPYVHNLRAIISCYLNDVDYTVLFNTVYQKLSIKNIDQIRNGLLSYVESRGLSLDQKTRLECEYSTREDILLKDIGLLNIYPGNMISDKWTITQADGNKEEFLRLPMSDSSFQIRSDIPEFFSLKRNKDKQKGARLPREYTVDSNTGIILYAESFPKKEGIDKDQNEELIYKIQRSYHYTFKLLSYSKWMKRTIVCGKIKYPEIEDICLEYRANIVGHDTDHMIIEINSDGSFSIPLDIENAVKYRLYLLERFPINSNAWVNLYIEPGDSIHLIIDENDKNDPLFSGRGYKNSEFLNKRSIPKFSKNNLIYFPEYLHFRMFDQYRDHIRYSEKLLESERNNLSPGFYNFMDTEIQSVIKMLEISDTWQSFRKDPEALKNLNELISGIPKPQKPNYQDFGNLEIYPYYISLYTDFRYLEFNSSSTKIYTPNKSADQLIFSRFLLDGIPLYLDIVSRLEAIANNATSYSPNYNSNYHFENILESLNNMDVIDYVRNIQKQVNALQPGSEMPRMNLVDLDGKKWDWDKTKGKTVVFMLCRQYEYGQENCEDIYKEYGSNKKDVVILRISPGISFQHWKDSNLQYSKGMHQMYFPDGEDAFKDRFLMDYGNPFKDIVIDREGKIFRNSGIGNLKIAIKEAIDLPLLPKKPFIETEFVRIFLGVLLGMILSFILYRIIVYRRLKRRALLQKMADLEQKAMKAQLNPHFLFNSLNSIQELIQSRQLKEANTYLTVFASLIRKILDNSERESVSIAEEVETLEFYLDLEKIRFEFTYKIHIDPEIDKYNTMMPTMMLQPIIENAILHGLAPKEGDNKLTIEASLADEYIVFKVEDNGIGRQASSSLHPEHESKGLNIIQSRIDTLNRTAPDNYKLRITDLEDKNKMSMGTLVEIFIPDEK